MSDTPRTDKFYEDVWRFTNETDAVDALISMRDLCRELERENAALREERNQLIDGLRSQVKQLTQCNRELAQEISQRKIREQLAAAQKEAQP